MLRGHEFHYSTWEDASGRLQRLYTIQPDALRPDARTEGGRVGNLLASYVHLLFQAMPELAERFVTAASVGAGAL
jgi:cobyrinic acid a,c-diamide synthase